MGAKINPLTVRDYVEAALMELRTAYEGLVVERARCYEGGEPHSPMLVEVQQHMLLALSNLMHAQSDEPPQEGGVPSGA